MNKQLYEQLEQATARIERVLHIGGMVTDGDSLPDDLDDMLVEDDKALSLAFPDMPAWVKEALGDRHERGPAFAEWVHMEAKLGFVVKFATPVMRNVNKDGWGSYSWGNYYTRWVYGQTLEDAVQRALEWVAERRADELEKQQSADAARS